jgi:hypothetical protein
LSAVATSAITIYCVFLDLISVDAYDSEPLTQILWI